MSHPPTVDASASGMRARGPLGGVARLLAMALAMLALVGVHVVATPLRAAAADPTVTVTLASMTPTMLTAAPAPSQRITLTGTLANTSSQALRSVQVYLWRDTTPITGDTALTQYLASDPATPVGRRAVDTEKATYPGITTTAQPSFAPGQSAPFSVSAQANLLGFGAPGVYPIGVQVRAALSDGRVETVGRGRTMMVVQQATSAATTKKTANASLSKLPWTPVVELSARPTLLAGSTFANADLADDLTGRLSRLLALAARPGVSTLVDPALVDEVRVLKGPHSIAGDTSSGATASVQEATRQRIATRWLAQLQKVLDQRRAWRMPWADADLSLLVPGATPRGDTPQTGATHGTGSTDVRDRARAAVTGSLSASDDPVAAAVDRLPLVVVPRAGSTSEALLGSLSPLHPALVLSADADTGVDAATHLPVRALQANLTAGGPRPAPMSTGVQVRSALLAHALLATRSQRGAPVVPIGDDAGMALFDLTADSATPTPLTAPTSGVADMPAQAPTPGIDTWATAVQHASESLDTWGDLTGLTSLAASRQQAAIARSMSSWFTTDAQRGAWLDQVSHQVGDVDAGNLVVARMTNDFVLSGSHNVLPATVTNHLGTAVHVKMTFTSESPQRLQIPDTDVTTIRPGETGTLHFMPHPSSNGVVTVVAQLRTPTGRPIGQPIRVGVRATSFGKVGWIIVVASGVAFMGLTTWRIRQVQRERAQQRERRIASGTSDVLRAAGFPEAPPNGQTGTQQGADGQTGATHE